MVKPLDVLSRAGDAGLHVVPQAKALRLELVSMSPAEAIIKLPYREELIGEPDSGILAGGAVTTLLDHVCSQAVWAALEEFMVIATLDLRIDYTRPARPGLDLFGHAHCYKLTRSVAFVRASAYETDRSDPVSTAQAAFMLTRLDIQPTPEQVAAVAGR
ncbi:MAG: PaaI family thioesterase [Caulobacteraceae bacterium]